MRPAQRRRQVEPSRYPLEVLSQAASLTIRIELKLFPVLDANGFAPLAVVRVQPHGVRPWPNANGQPTEKGVSARLSRHVAAEMGRETCARAAELVLSAPG